MCNFDGFIIALHFDSMILCCLFPYSFNLNFSRCFIIRNIATLCIYLLAVNVIVCSRNVNSTCTGQAEEVLSISDRIFKNQFTKFSFTKFALMIDFLAAQSHDVLSFAFRHYCKFHSTKKKNEKCTDPLWTWKCTVNRWPVTIQ